MDPKKILKLDFLHRPITTELFGIRAKKVGLPPGSLIHVGKQKTEKTTEAWYNEQFIPTQTDGYQFGLELGC